MSNDTATVATSAGDGVDVPLSAAAFKVASMAAGQIGVATADWVALAVLAAAAEQSGLGGEDDPGSGEGEPASAPADEVTQTLARLEAKLDAVLQNASDLPAGTQGS